jgi:hypothetical protein
MDQIYKDTAELSDNTIVPNDAQANSQYLLTILETRGEIFDRVEKAVPSLSLISSLIKSLLTYLHYHWF